MPKILNDVKNSMLLEVEKLLDSGGYAAVTVRAVALGCGVSVGTVYNYFPSKEAMVAEYILTDWRQCLAACEAVSESSATAGPVAECICRELVRFSRRHEAIFLDKAAQGSFAGSFSRYHGLLRSQLAALLRKFTDGDFAAEFMAEALLTWTMAGKEFSDIWAQLNPGT